MWYGIKTGWQLPILPYHLIKIESNIYIRLFKFIGNIFMFLVMSHISFQFNTLVFYMIYIISLLFIIYKIINAIKQWFNNLVLESL